jgi:hypothetical protein
MSNHDPYNISRVLPPLHQTICQVVVLHHFAIDQPHFDLMIEPTPGAPLWTWRTPTWPPASGTTLTQLADHRNEYLEFEGELTKNRGQVRQVYTGKCRVTATGDTITLTALADAPFNELRLRQTSGDQWQAISG